MKAKIHSGASFYKDKKRVGHIRKKHKRSGGYLYTYDPKVKAIKGFKGEYSFLSNFSFDEVTMYGETFYTAEHAYQYHKSDSVVYRNLLKLRGTAAAAKRYSRQLKELRPDWDTVKYKIMFTVVLLKFVQNPDAARKLLDTGMAYLEETNHWGDTTWGVFKRVGHNHLGRILMCVRYILRDRSWGGAKGYNSWDDRSHRTSRTKKESRRSRTSRSNHSSPVSRARALIRK